MDAKQLIGEQAASYVKDGMIVGLGTGSTAHFATVKIAEMIKGGLKIKAVPTSQSTETLALELDIPLLPIEDVTRIDVTIDGADEFDAHKNLIKGGGAALLREKIIASVTDFYVIIADAKKRSKLLGSFAVPVEITPFGKEITLAALKALGCDAKLRYKQGQLLLTDNKNHIADCKFAEIKDPLLLSQKINAIPGVVESGLFCNMADVIITEDGEGGVVIIQ